MIQTGSMASLQQKRQAIEKEIQLKQQALLKSEVELQDVQQQRSEVREKIAALHLVLSRRLSLVTGGAEDPLHRVALEEQRQVLLDAVSRVQSRRKDVEVQTRTLLAASEGVRLRLTSTCAETELLKKRAAACRRDGRQLDSQLLAVRVEQESTSAEIQSVTSRISAAGKHAGSLLRSVSATRTARRKAMQASLEAASHEDDLLCKIHRLVVANTKLLQWIDTHRGSLKKGTTEGSSSLPRAASSSEAAPADTSDVRERRRSLRHSLKSWKCDFTALEGRRPSTADLVKVPHMLAAYEEYLSTSAKLERTPTDENLCRENNDSNEGDDGPTAPS